VAILAARNANDAVVAFGKVCVCRDSGVRRSVLCSFVLQESVFSRLQDIFTFSLPYKDWWIGYDGVRLTSQNCCLYGPIVHPRLIVDHGMMVSTGANSHLVYQSSLAATSSLAVVSPEISLKRVGEWTKEMRI
jgi:hypothetical protein